MSSKLKSMFESDGAQMIETLDYVVNQLEERGFEQELIDQAFRTVHSLKSESSFLGHGALTDTAGALEDLFEGWRRRKGPLSTETLNELLNAMHDLKQQFRSVNVPASAGKTGSAPSNAETESAQKGQGARAIPDPEFAIRATPFQRQLLRESRVRGETLFRVDCEIDSAEPMAYPRLYLVISNLEQAVHVIKMHPDIETIRAGRSGFVQALITTSEPEARIARSINVDQIRRTTIQQLEYDPLLQSDADSERGATDGSAMRSFSVSMPARLYEELCLNADEIHSRLSQEWSELSKAPIDSGIRSRIQWNLFLVNRLVGWMRNEISGFSTAPLAEVFHNLAEVVDELARRLGKRVILKTQGEHERVYLPVSDVLTDVMLHLIRNAIDHGIETPDVRKSRGKPESGIIRILASSTDENLTIRVEDDGNGIPESLVRSLENGDDRPGSLPPVRRGGKGEHDRDVVDQRDLLSVISRSGFTTRTRPGEVSGRGVGLDVVSYSVRKLLCGRFELENRPGKGCTFSLVLPLSTNLVTVLVLQAMDEYLALPRVFVTNTFELDRRFVFTDSNETTYYRYSGENVRMYTVHENFPESMTLEKKRIGVMIAIADERGVIVADKLVSEETVVQDRRKRNVVFSQVLNRDVRLFLPSQLLSAFSFKRGEPA